MSTQEVKKVPRGLTIRKFRGKISEDKDKGISAAEYIYPRVVLPKSRTGKDVDGAEVSGTIPSFSELLAALQKSGFPMEIETDEEGNETNNSVTSLLIVGWNTYENLSARNAVVNTEETTKNKVILMIMSKMGMTRDKAIEFAKSIA